MVMILKKRDGFGSTLVWRLSDELFSTKEKVELYASVREALLNVRKHAHAKEVWIRGKEERKKWICVVEDDGRGYEGDPRGASAETSIFDLLITYVWHVVA
ncbi:hypothetical protein O9H85_21975 [Paenibacillus filicis]|uniref:Histidine kinase/HSP90-like ATPase domain-containing protein n=1 Tax=Paenibacillus gyeongsangnamensis TaxID=3388067 RepID=A0ABT4QDV3_9BACL|nr:hypothetical protein [Paenibacillus filicis]MCZ8515040.1 hypothetical protein [Paenibacillus filicis]